MHSGPCGHPVNITSSDEYPLHGRLNLTTSAPLGNFIESQFGSWYQFLTVLGLISAILTMAVAILKDVLPQFRMLDSIKNAIGIVSVPAEGMIAILYWGLRAYDPKLLLQDDPKYRIPLPLDLSLHAVPAAILWIDFLLFSPPYSEKSRPLLLSATMTAGYTTWMEYCKSRNGNFPYPFLGELGLPQRLTFYAACTVVAYVLFKIANSIHIALDRLLGKNVRVAKRQAQGKSL